MAETLRDLVVSLSLQTDNFTRNIKSVNKQIAEAESQFKLAASGVEGFERSATGLATQLSTLERRLSLQKDAVNLYQRALENREKRTWAATTMDEVKELAKANTGYIKTMWCGDLACEMKMKEEAGLSSRCMPFEQEQLSDVCPCCGKPAKTMVYWGVAY